MKKIAIVVLLIAIASSVFSQNQGYKFPPSKKDCSLEKCLKHCVNHKKICSVWDKNGYVEIYHQVITLNKGRFVDINKIKIGDSIIFPPFSSWGKEIGKETVLIAEKNECAWTLVHRYLGENYLFCLNVGNRDVVNHVYKPKTKTMAFGSTTIIW